MPQLSLLFPLLSLLAQTPPATGPALGGSGAANLPRDPLTTGVLILLALLAAAATVIAFQRLRRRDPDPSLARTQAALIGFCIVGSAGLFVYRWLLIKGGGKPLEAHVDGLLLIAALFGSVVMFLQARARLPGLSLFALPVLTVVLAWAICASWWTLHPFHIATVWNALHLASVYLGTLFFALGAIAGSMYLVVEHRLRRKVGLVRTTPLASLETLERAIIHTSAVGFALLTLGMLTGAIITISGGALRPESWYAPKVLLGATAWLITALVMNVRHATSFRGARAAWLTIAVFILMLATFAASNALPRRAAQLPISNCQLPDEKTGLRRSCGHPWPSGNWQLAIRNWQSPEVP